MSLLGVVLMIVLLVQTRDVDWWKGGGREETLPQSREASAVTFNLPVSRLFPHPSIKTLTESFIEHDHSMRR